jgi:hypothetical protein
MISVSAYLITDGDALKYNKAVESQQKLLAFFLQKTGESGQVVAQKCGVFGFGF